MIRKHVNVLLIEDSESDRALITRRLARVANLGFSLKAADYLELGLKRLSEGGIDVLLLDLNLPDSVGLDTVVSARAQSPDVPIVVLTGLEDDELGLEAIRIGADDYLAKSNMDRDVLARSLLYAIERKKVESAERQLIIAREIQQRLYPSSAPDLPGCDIAGFCSPAELSGGDYYDYIPFADETTGIVIGDVSGHGVGAALIMAEVRAALRSLAVTSSDITGIAAAINQLLLADTTSEQFVTLFMTKLDPVTRQLTYLGAGHHAYHFSANGASILKSHFLPLGLSPDFEIEQIGRLELQSDDILVLMTDGLVETRSPEGVTYGADKVVAIVEENRQLPCSTIAKMLFDAAREFAEHQPQSDDIAVVVVKMLGE